MWLALALGRKVLNLVKTLEEIETVGQVAANTVIHGDCLGAMKYIADKSVDMILCDLPYGTTACKWDTVIPFEPLWEQYKRIVKPNAAIVLTASQPFTSQLVMSNPKWFRYEWIWEKCQGTGFANAKIQPLRNHENILIFYEKSPSYSPQKTASNKIDKSQKRTRPSSSDVYRVFTKMPVYVDDGTRYPTTIMKFYDKERCDSSTIDKGRHPTQKPVALFEYLIKTYTSEGDLILDNCAGSGTTAIAAINTNRNYILIEKELEYIEVIKERIAKHSPKDYSVIPDSPTLEKSGQLALF